VDCDGRHMDQDEGESAEPGQEMQGFARSYQTA